MTTPTPVPATAVRRYSVVCHDCHHDLVAIFSTDHAAVADAFAWAHRFDTQLAVHRPIVVDHAAIREAYHID